VASLLPLHNFYSISIRLPEPCSSEAGETWVRNMAAEFCLQSIFFMLIHAVNLRHGTDGFTSPPKKVVLRIFITPKNPSSSAGFEPANLGSSGKHATTRPPRTTVKEYDTWWRFTIMFVFATIDTDVEWVRLCYVQVANYLFEPRTFLKIKCSVLMNLLTHYDCIMNVYPH
jgi:hypothetical protein